jgi:hypothetical protein
VKGKMTTRWKIKGKCITFVKEKGNNGHKWKPLRKGEEMLAVHPSITPETQSFNK